MGHLLWHFLATLGLASPQLVQPLTVKGMFFLTNEVDEDYIILSQKKGEGEESSPSPK